MGSARVSKRERLPSSKSRDAGSRLEVAEVAFDRPDHAHGSGPLPSTSANASTSMGSPRAVPVPCVSTSLHLGAFDMRALERRTNDGALRLRPLGAVRTVLRRPG